MLSPPAWMHEQLLSGAESLENLRRVIGRQSEVGGLRLGSSVGRHKVGVLTEGRVGRLTPVSFLSDLMSRPVPEGTAHSLGVLPLFL